LCISQYFVRFPECTYNHHLRLGKRPLVAPVPPVTKLKMNRPRPQGGEELRLWQEEAAYLIVKHRKDKKILRKRMSNFKRDEQKQAALKLSKSAMRTLSRRWQKLRVPSNTFSTVGKDPVDHVSSITCHDLSITFGIFGKYLLQGLLSRDQYWAVSQMFDLLRDFGRRRPSKAFIRDLKIRAVRTAVLLEVGSLNEQFS
jgi:hypothetical protein